VALVLLAIGCVQVLRPFISPLLWATILAFTTWPVFEYVRDRCGARSTLAALVMTSGLALALVVPLVVLGASLADNAENLLHRLAESGRNGTESIAPPSWLASIPYLGQNLGQYWRELMSNTGTLVSTVVPYLGPVRDAAVKSGITVGRGVIELSLSILIAFFLYRDGLRAVANVRRIGHRIAGRRAIRMLDVASNTIRSVVYGMIGTAIVQGAVAALGLWIAGVPAPFLLGVLTFFLALLPIGAPFVWIPASIWLLNQGELGWGIFMAAWGLGVISSVDNFVRPYLISKGSNLPFLLVFMGVIGGVLTFGILGIFLGPTVLAVALALMREWLEMGKAEVEAMDDEGYSDEQAA